MRQDVLVATELRLLADFFQIHVFDEGSETDFGDLWTSQTVRDGLAAGPGRGGHRHGGQRLRPGKRGDP